MPWHHIKERLMKTDMQLHKDVLAELTWDPRIEHKEIGVAAKNGVVTLSGSVSSYSEKWEAERAAERVSGVKAVANDMTVTLPATAEFTDADIAHRAVNSLDWDIQVPSDRIKMAVSSGWITLTGDVDWSFQRDAALRSVRNLAGVRGVTNSITVQPRFVSSYDVSRNIKEALERRADRTADKILVEAKDSVVTLKGTVPSYSDRRVAEGAAWLASGVTQVRDELVVAV
jgi:osmotically-inducible protein OsmY